MWYISKHITILYRSAGLSWTGDRIYVSVTNGYVEIRDNNLKLVYSDEDIFGRL